MNEELKPCPFCGNKDVKNVAYIPPRRFFFAVACEICRIEGPAFYTCPGRSGFKKYGFDEAKQLAIDAWNKRA
jgi:Lar family restriction alleviation protein